MTCRRESEVDGRAASVIIATYDGAEFIGDQLESLVAELNELDHGSGVDGPRAFEVIIADNGSTDATRSVAARFVGRLPITIIDGSAQRGQAFARNIGAAAATSDRLLFLDQDDVVLPGYVTAMLAALDEHPVVAAAMRTDQLNSGWVRSARALTQTSRLPIDFGERWAYGCTLGVRRQVFESVGGFDPALRPAGEDVDLCIRLAKAGHPTEFVEGAVVQYRFPSTLRALFRQGRLYGLGHVNVCVRHGTPVRVGDVVAWIRVAAAAAVWTLPGRSMERRGQGASALGRRVGLLEGTARQVLHRWCECRP